MVDRQDFESFRPSAADIIASEVLARLEAGGDPRRAIRHLNAEIIAFQGAGAELPAALIRLSSTITTSCALPAVGCRPN